MSQIRLMLADNDAMFLERFGAYLQKNKSNRFYLELITSPSILDDWLNNHGKADLAVISASMFNELDNKPESRNTAILSDGPESLLPQGYTVLQKYKPAEALMNEILSLCSEKLPERSKENEAHSPLELVLYADGSDVENPLAQSLALLGAQDGKSVFYMSLDTLPVTDSYFVGNNEKGLSEMLYYIKAHKENIVLKAEACTSKDLDTGISFMRGHKNPEDIGKLSASELEILLKSIAERGCYEKIIISRAFLYDPLLPQLLKKASKIYITALDYRTSIERLKSISSLLLQMDEDTAGTSIRNKAVFCIQLRDRVPYSQSFNLSHFPLMYLPYPFGSGSEMFPPSSHYISALRTALD